MGNPETDDYYDNKGLVEYAWSHSVVSDEEYERINKSCNFKLPIWSGDCNSAMKLLFEIYGEIDIYNIYAPKCLLNTSSSSSSLTAIATDDGGHSSAEVCFFNHALSGGD